MDELNLVAYFAAHAPGCPEWWCWPPQDPETPPGFPQITENPMERLVAWRWAFAKAMIKMRPSKKPPVI